MWWVPVVIFIGLGLFVVVATELRERQTKKGGNAPAAATTKKRTPIDGECCGQHAVCERESLLNQRAEIIYYNDEELDTLSGISPDEYTDEQVREIEEVFYTLQEKDVAGWLKSLQLRNIVLPNKLRDEALMIISERRKTGYMQQDVPSV